jgi:hypothetical protein
MATSLVACTKEEQCAVIRFLYVEGIPAAEIYQYENCALPRGSVFEYIDKLKNCITSVTDAE